MGQNSKIEWTTHTFNPWWGCTKVSEACKHCYAEAWAKRVGQQVWGPQVDRWWGSEKWRDLADMSQITLSITVADRFQKELGYRFANPYPIYMNDQGQKKAFILIHATDHAAAPKLMQAAYNAIYPDRPGSPSDSQKPLFGGDQLPITADKRMRE